MFSSDSEGIGGIIEADVISGVEYFALLDLLSFVSVPTYHLISPSSDSLVASQS